MKKLLHKLFFWLFKEDFERMNKLESDLKGLIHRQKSATQEAEVHAARIRQLMGSIDVLVDVHHRQALGWLCPYRVGADHIKFIDLDNRKQRLLR